MTPIGMQAAQQRIAQIQGRFSQPAPSFAAGLARAQSAAVAPPVPPATAARGTAGAPAVSPAIAPGLQPGLQAGLQPGLASAVAPALAPAIAPAITLAVSPVAPVGTAAAAAPMSPAAAAAVPAAATWAADLPPQAQPWLGAVESAAGQAGIDPRLLAALVQAESGFRADARSAAGAVGLGQLMPATARGLGVDPQDPVQNLQGAARYLRSQLDRFGSVELALAAYNAGPGRVAQAGGIPRIQETQQYVTRVVQTYDRLRNR